MSEAGRPDLVGEGPCPAPVACSLCPQFLGGQKKLTLEECMQMDEGPWRDPKVLGSLYAEGKGLRASELAFQMVPLPQVPEQSN